MSVIKEQRIPSEHSPDEVWWTINIPLTGALGRLVNPYVLIEYEDLSDKGGVQRGTLVTYKPLKEKLPDLGMFADFMPDDVALRVEEHDLEDMVTVGVVESDKHAGMVRQSVEEADDGTGLLVVSGEISLGGKYGMFSAMVAPYAERGLREHSQRILDHVPEIIGR